jgi:class 3 adenylate cyclase
VTSGTAYCGLVGASYRCEYALMGPAVNLAARLMCKCEEKGVELLCNDQLHDKVPTASFFFFFQIICSFVSPRVSYFFFVKLKFHFIIFFFFFHYCVVCRR